MRVQACSDPPGSAGDRLPYGACAAPRRRQRASRSQSHLGPPDTSSRLLFSKHDPAAKRGSISREGRDQGSSGVRTRNRRNGDCCGLRFFELNARARRAPFFFSDAASGRLRPYWGAWLGRRSAGTEFCHGHGHVHCLRFSLACPFPARHHDGEPPTGSSSAYRTQAQLEAQAQSRSRRASQTQSAHQRRHRHISKSVFRSSVHLLICPSSWPLSDDPSPAHGAGSVYTHPYRTIDGSQLLSRFSSRRRSRCKAHSSRTQATKTIRTRPYDMIRGLNLRAALDNPAQPNLNESHINTMQC